MSQSLHRKLVRYRNWLVAIVNSAVTWTVLIIAPLGLWAVIICTVCVFFSSLIVGWIGDRALLNLLRDSYQDVIPVQNSDSINFTQRENLDLPQPQRRTADD
jgi:hypothetical protein